MLEVTFLTRKLHIWNRRDLYWSFSKMISGETHGGYLTMLLFHYFLSHISLCLDFRVGFCYWISSAAWILFFGGHGISLFVRPVLEKESLSLHYFILIGNDYRWFSLVPTISASFPYTLNIHALVEARSCITGSVF